MNASWNRVLVCRVSSLSVVFSDEAECKARENLNGWVVMTDCFERRGSERYRSWRECADRFRLQRRAQERARSPLGEDAYRVDISAI